MKGREFAPGLSCIYIRNPYRIPKAPRLGHRSKNLQWIVEAFPSCSSLLIDIRLSGLFVAILKKPLPFNDDHFLSDNHHKTDWFLLGNAL
jgi:hypothetical protein